MAKKVAKENESTEATPVATKRVNSKYKVKQLVTLPHLQLQTNVEYALRIVTPFTIGKAHENAPVDKDTGKPRKPPMLAHALDYETGEMVTIIGGASLLTELNDKYPENGYVGLSFCIMPGEKKKAKNGNNFVPYTITEIFPPDAE